MKNIVLILALLVSGYGFSQKNDVEIKKQGDLTQATYYYDNGNIQQQGTFNKEGELHGEWISYSIDGKKTALANYDNGKKSGKWFFWNDDVLREVDFVNSKIASVQEWKQNSNIVLRN